MPPPVSSLQSVAVSSTAASIDHASPEPLLERLFSVRNEEFERFKTDTYKVCYPTRPRVGVTAFVARRDHPGHGIARLWHRARDLCSASASEGRLRSGEKIHLSVAPNQLRKAYQCVNAMLTDDNCPIDDFKVVNPDIADADENSHAGGQVTLYVHGQTHPKAVRRFLLDLGMRLVEAGIKAGTAPKEDSPMTSGPKSNEPTIDNDRYLAFFSYRNTELPIEDGNVPPFFQTAFYKEFCKPSRQSLTG